MYNSKTFENYFFFIYLSDICPKHFFSNETIYTYHEIIIN